MGSVSRDLYSSSFFRSTTSVPSFLFSYIDRFFYFCLSETFSPAPRSLEIISHLTLKRFDRTTAADLLFPLPRLIFLFLISVSMNDVLPPFSMAIQGSLFAGYRHFWLSYEPLSRLTIGVSDCYPAISSWTVFIIIYQIIYDIQWNLYTHIHTHTQSHTYTKYLNEAYTHSPTVLYAHIMYIWNLHTHTHAESYTYIMYLWNSNTHTHTHTESYTGIM